MRVMTVAAPLCGLAGLLQDTLAAESFARIGTGGDPGVYYAAGARICRDVDTFGVRATFVTSKHVPDNIVVAVVRSVFEDLSRLQEQHPALADLTPRRWSIWASRHRYTVAPSATTQRTT